jgi:hypothetical protein
MDKLLSAEPVFVQKADDAETALLIMFAQVLENLH